MEDHHYTCSYDTYSDNLTSTDIEKTDEESADVENISIEEKEGDDFLIELYRERKFLYDKSHRDFKNKQIKENAWFEISTIMQQKNLGKHYTPEYCQTRCTSLRDQYSREKRNIKDEYKSGSGCSKRKTFPFFTQLSFLDNFIKRRRTFSNIERKKNTLQSLKDTEAIHEKDNNNGSAEKLESERQDTIKISQKRNINACLDEVQNTANQQDLNKKGNIPRFKKSKIDKSRNMDNAFTNISNAVMNFLENTKENTTTNVKTVDQSFVDYIRVHLENIPEPEKSVRKKLLFDALTAPLPKTCPFFTNHKCEILVKQLFYHLAAILQ